VIRAVEKGSPLAIVRILVQTPPYELLAKPSIIANKFYAIRPGHPNIGYDATRTQLINCLKKAAGRFVGLDAESEHAEHLAERMPDRLLIVYDKDRRGGHLHGTFD
jgi:hypothetical protein